MMEHRKVGELKIKDRKPSGGKIKALRCVICNAVVVSNRPGDPYKCECGWEKSRS